MNGILLLLHQISSHLLSERPPHIASHRSTSGGLRGAPPLNSASAKMCARHAMARRGLNIQYIYTILYSTFFYFLRKETVRVNSLETLSERVERPENFASSMDRIGSDRIRVHWIR